MANEGIQLPRDEQGRVIIPRPIMDAFLKQQGLGGIAALPTKLAMFLGKDSVPVEAAAVAEQMGLGHDLVMSLSCGTEAMHFVVK